MSTPLLHFWHLGSSIRLLPLDRPRPGKLSRSTLDNGGPVTQAAAEARPLRRVPPRGIEPLPQAPEACVISISPRGRGTLAGYHKRPGRSTEVTPASGAARMAAVRNPRR